MTANETTQEQNLNDFLQHNISNTIKELEAKAEDKEKSDKEVFKQSQEVIEGVKDVAGDVGNSVETINQAGIFTENIKKISTHIQIILGDIGKPLSFTNYVLELYTTDDRMTFYAKIGNDIISGLTFAEILAASQKISDYLINKIKLIPKKGHPFIIIIGGVAGIVTGKSLGDMIEAFTNNIVDFIVDDIMIGKGKGIKFFKPLENFLQRHFNFPAKPSCPKGSTMPDGSCAPSPQEFWYPLFSFLFLSPYPKPSQAHQEALAKTKELKSKITLASSPHIQSDVSNGYIDERDLQEYKEQQYVLQKEQRLYTQALQDYTQELAYKSSILNFYLERLGDSILPHITENRGLTYNEALNLVSKNNYMIKILDESDIDSINVHSPFAYLRALFLCENIIVVDEQGNPTLNESNLFRYLGYKDDAAIIFALDKQTLTKDYLNTRKSLYKTIMNLREQREQDYKEEQERISQLSYEEYQREREKTLREQQRQERIQRARNPNTTNHLILETKDKNNVIIFLDSDISLSNLIHIHNNKIDIFTKDGTILDIQRLETLLQEYSNSNNANIIIPSNTNNINTDNIHTNTKDNEITKQAAFDFSVYDSNLDEYWEGLYQC